MQGTCCHAQHRPRSLVGGVGAIVASPFIVQDDSEEPRRVLGDGTSRSTAAGTASRQGQRSVARYAEELQTVAFWYGWPAASQMDAFLLGLADRIKDLMAADERPTSLDGTIELAVRLELQVQACGHSAQLSPPFWTASDGDCVSALPLLLPQPAASEPLSVPVPELIPTPVSVSAPAGSVPAPPVCPEVLPDSAPDSAL